LCFYEGLCKEYEAKNIHLSPQKIHNFMLMILCPTFSNSLPCSTYFSHNVLEQIQTQWYKYVQPANICEKQTNNGAKELHI